MRFSVKMTIVHIGVTNPIIHSDTLEARSLASALKHFNLTAKQACELKNTGLTKWVDGLGARHTLELKKEVN